MLRNLIQIQVIYCGTGDRCFLKPPCYMKINHRDVLLSSGQNICRTDGATYQSFGLSRYRRSSY